MPYAQDQLFYSRFAAITLELSHCFACQKGYSLHSIAWAIDFLPVTPSTKLSSHFVLSPCSLFCPYISDSVCQAPHFRSWKARQSWCFQSVRAPLSSVIYVFLQHLSDRLHRFVWILRPFRPNRSHVSPTTNGLGLLSFQERQSFAPVQTPVARYMSLERVLEVTLRGLWRHLGGYRALAKAAIASS